MADNRLGQGVLGVAFHCGGQCQKLVLADPVGDDVGDLGFALGKGPGLVHDHGMDAGGGLQGHRVLEQHAPFGAQTGADHDRGRGGQAERVRAGDDHHGNGEQHGRAGRAAGGQQPHRQGQAAADQGHQHKPERGPVGQPLPGRFGVLRLLD